MQPAKVRDLFSVEQIRTWFEAADTDHSGDVSISEYFVWTLQMAAEKHGQDAISLVFGEYDHDHSGFINLAEFSAACDDAGFELVAHSIFRELDKDGSGQVSLKELSDVMREGTCHSTAHTHSACTLHLRIRALCRHGSHSACTLHLRIRAHSSHWRVSTVYMWCI
jgi:Ca2+-binding EF-hand superfamily protein